MPRESVCDRTRRLPVIVVVVRPFRATHERWLALEARPPSSSVTTTTSTFTLPSRSLALPLRQPQADWPLEGRRRGHDPALLHDLQDALPRQRDGDGAGRGHVRPPVLQPEPEPGHLGGSARLGRAPLPQQRQHGRPQALLHPRSHAQEEVCCTLCRVAHTSPRPCSPAARASARRSARPRPAEGAGRGGGAPELKMNERMGVCTPPDIHQPATPLAQTQDPGRVGRRRRRAAQPPAVCGSGGPV